jgi:hypothetical protein
MPLSNNELVAMSSQAASRDVGRKQRDREIMSIANRRRDFVNLFGNWVRFAEFQ